MTKTALCLGGISVHTLVYVTNIRVIIWVIGGRLRVKYCLDQRDSHTRDSGSFLSRLCYINADVVETFKLHPLIAGPDRS